MFFDQNNTNVFFYSVSVAHALPMFREARQRSTRKQLEKDRLDPKKSHKPEPPVSGPGKVLFFLKFSVCVSAVSVPGKQLMSRKKTAFQVL